jgi:1-acyl-sn-glycerol-3-phosphate acyltransferase
MMRVVLGLLFHAWLVLITLFAGGMVILVSYLSPNASLIQEIARWWGRILLKLGHIPLQVEGLEHLAPGQAYVYAANHRSNFDIYVLLATLPGPFLFVAKKSLFEIPVFGQALARMGSIPIDRTNLQAAVQSLNQAAAIVKSGVSMIIFPEGTRATSRELLPFKKGVFVMALKAGQPIVPVSISGTRFIQPRGAIRVKPGPVKVVISPPISPTAFRRKEDLILAVRQAMEAHYDPDFPYGSGN